MIVINTHKCPEMELYSLFSFAVLFRRFQLRNRDGVFVPATPVSGTVLVNIGDVMARWTADKLISTVRFGYISYLKFDLVYMGC